MIRRFFSDVKNAWAFYDWANSVYPLVITTAIFPLFYEGITSSTGTDKVIFLGFEFVNTALISYVGALGFLVVSVLVPILSGIADYSDSKKKFLRGFAYLGSFSCMGLYFFNLENLFIGLLFYLLALIGFWGSIVFYNAYLPLVAPTEEHDRLSAKGYSLGYLGSSVLLIICLSLYLSGIMPVKVSFLLTGIWWILFSQFTLRKLPEGVASTDPGKKILWKGFQEINKVLLSLKDHLALRRFLISFFVYSMGVQTVMLVAVYFGTKEIAWADESEKTTGLIVSVLIIQFIAIPGANFMARLSERIGNIRTLMLANSLWVIICLVALWIETPLHFYCTAGFVGFVMGGIQSMSRSTYSKLLPKTHDTASYFSFYDVAEKVGIVIGLFLFAFFEEWGDMRSSIVSLILFFFLGLLLLFRMPKRSVLEGRNQ